MDIRHKGRLGEARTESFLIERFMVLERSQDVDGADFLVQSVDSQPLGYLPPMVRVQAKFRGFGSEIRIPVSYISFDGGRPKPDFFLFVHMGKRAEDLCWFFTANELTNQAKLSSDSKYYHFRISCTDDFAFHLNRMDDDVYSQIENGLRKTDLHGSRLIFTQFKNPVASSFITDLSLDRCSLNEGTLEILQQLQYLDIALVRKAASVTLSTPDYSFILPLNEYAFYPGVSSGCVGLEFLFAVDPSSVRGNLQASRIESGKCERSGNTVSRIPFCEGLIEGLELADVQGRLHHYSASEGLGGRMHCLDHDGCVAQMYGYNETNWGHRPRTWGKSKPIISALDPLWRVGPLGEYLSPDEWRRLYRLGLISACESVVLDWRHFERRELSFNGKQFSMCIERMSPVQPVSEAIELTAAGRDFINLLIPAAAPPVGYRSMVEFLLEHQGFVQK